MNHTEEEWIELKWAFAVEKRDQLKKAIKSLNPESDEYRATNTHIDRLNDLIKGWEVWLKQQK